MRPMFLEHVALASVLLHSDEQDKFFLVAVRPLK